MGETTKPLKLSARQRGSLLVVIYARGPGYIERATDPSLRALERRGLVDSRPDFTAPGRLIWTVTGAGRAWWVADRRTTL